MFEQYLTHFAVILIPLLFLQIWVFRKSFHEIPFRGSLMAVYGAGTAILDQAHPITIFGLPASFVCVPVIISFLYGKRVAGLISMGLLIGWDTVTRWHHGSPFLPVDISIILYSIIPFLIGEKFSTYRHRTRWLLGALMSLITIAVQTVTYAVSVVWTHTALRSHPGLVVHLFATHLLPYFGAPFVFQTILIVLPILLLDNVIEDGQLRMNLLNNEHRYQSLVHFNPTGICILDTDNRFVMVNAAYQKITGYSQQELIGKNRFDLWFPEDREYALKLGRTLYTGEVLIDVSGTLRHKNGHRIEARFTSVPSMVNGNVTGYFSLVTDVTETLQMEKQLRDTEKLSMVGQLAASIAHEIKNPLTALFGFLKLLKENPGQKETTLAYVDIMHGELDRMNQISGQLLMLGKPQLDTFEAHDVSVIARDVVTLLEPQMNMSNVAACLHLNEQPLRIWCDKNQIKQALINIVKNAIEAMAAFGGTITIEAKLSMASETDTSGTGHGVLHGEVPNRRLRDFIAPDVNNPTSDLQQVEILITDNGPGIPESLKARLGEPFYTTKAEGTGLGLLVTKRIVQAHGGTIEFHSGESTGTTVCLSFGAYVPSIPQQDGEPA